MSLSVSSSAPAKKSTKKTTKKQIPTLKNTSSTPSATSIHPKFSEMITEAIKSLNERSGSSKKALVKFIVSKYQLDSKKADQFIKITLKNGLKTSMFKQATGTGLAGSFKLGEKAKQTDKSKAIKPKVKKAAAVATTTTTSETKKKVVKKSTAPKNSASSQKSSKKQVKTKSAAKPAKVAVVPAAPAQKKSAKRNNPVITKKAAIAKRVGSVKDRRTPTPRKQIADKRNSLNKQAKKTTLSSSPKRALKIKSISVTIKRAPKATTQKPKAAKKTA